jgi:hypothetical protein
VPANIFQETSKIEVIAGRVDCDGRMGRRFACAANRRSLTRMLIAAALRQEGWRSSYEIDVVNDGAKGMRSLVTDMAPKVAAPMLDWFHLAMKLHAIRSALFANTFERVPDVINRCRRLWTRIREALWRGRAPLAIELTSTLIATLAAAISTLSAFYGRVAATAQGATVRLKEFLKNNSSILVNYGRARREGRCISTAPAESVMNHLVNRRMSKRQQMRWSVKGAQLMLQTRVDLLDGYLIQRFRSLYPHFRSPDLRVS